MSSSRPLFSIIIPVYNAAPYLALCIESLLRQPFRAVEYILVNDGSTDDSLTICRRYEAQDERIRVIDKANGGPSQSRNAGLSAARGEWLGFCDSDDLWLDANFLPSLADFLATHPVDWVRANYCAIDPMGNLLWDDTERDKSRKPYDHQMMDGSTFLRHIIKGEFFLWVTFIKSDVVRRSEARFNEASRYKEDIEWLLDVLPHASCFAYLDRAFYGYRKLPQSLSTPASQETLLRSQVHITRAVMRRFRTLDPASPLRAAYGGVIAMQFRSTLSALGASSLSSARRLSQQYGIPALQREIASLFAQSSPALPLSSALRFPPVAYSLCDASIRRMREALYRLYVKVFR